MTQLHLIRRVIKENVDKEIQELNRYARDIEKLPGEYQNQNISMHNFSFYSATDGKLKFYGNKEITIEEKYKFIVIHKNKQYQWLLAEAFEEFEDFIENIYAYIGFKDNHLWLLGDFGNITLDDLKIKDYAWFQEKSKNKKNVPQSMLERLRLVFPKIANLDTNNQLDVNLKLAIVLTENLRHVIVHKSGIVDSQDEFIKSTLQKAGLYNNGNPKAEDSKFIAQYFGTSEYENYISLLEMTHRPYPNLAFEVNTNIFESLTNYLLAYADICYEAIAEHFNDQNL